MKKYKAVIFDLDGVLCSTDELHYNAWLKKARDHGLTFNPKMNDKLRGLGREESLKAILKENHIEKTEEEIKEISEQKNEIYKKELKKLSKNDLSEDVKKTLDEIITRGYKIAIGSSSRNAQIILDRLGIKDLFDAISDGNGLQRSKPDPEVFIRAARYLNLDPADCLVIEDADVGIEAANRGGFDSAGISAAKFNKYATYAIDTLSDILKHL